MENYEYDERILRLREKTGTLPLQPGVYLMKNKSGTVIYVGKAKLLKNRVSSYFRSLEKHLPKVAKMVENVEDFDFIVTTSELEALVLECSLIKQYNPKYNILLKDAKGYNYIRISDPEGWSRITCEKTRKEDGAEYIGPFTSSFIVKETVEEVNRAFMLPTCTRQFPESIGNERPCLNYHIKRCSGVCTGKISLREYRETVDQAVQLIKNGHSAVVEGLTEQMNAAAENLDFEKAAALRDRIRALERVTEQQRVVLSGGVDSDVIATAAGGGICCVSMLIFRNFRLTDKRDFFFDEPDSISALMAEFIAQYYSDASLIPKRLLLRGECDDMTLLTKLLTERSGHRVEITRAQRGEPMRFAEMASQNAAQSLSTRTRQDGHSGWSGKDVAALNELAELLSLSTPPEYIEAYDISNIGGQTIVGGMVVFESGKPLRSAYRRFSIRDTVGAPDDYASLREVISRRISEFRAARERGDTSGFGRMPDLILLDGGAGQLSTVLPLLTSEDFHPPVFGMVKDKKHRTRAIAATGGEITISAHRLAFALVSTIQNETHRYAVSYARRSHTKKSFELSLTKAPGIGPARAKALLQQFKTISAIKSASAEELSAVKGMSLSLAQQLKDFFERED
ncbi:MAG: excinuclease ABC subunit UvrC [Oscillospiraceae bacterium]|nr:excinuclease ABC subunit UvrC [Oscillospiraceae bacterium]